MNSKIVAVIKNGYGDFAIFEDGSISQVTTELRWPDPHASPVTCVVFTPCMVECKQ